MSVSSFTTTAPARPPVVAGRPLPVWYSLLLAVPLTAATVYGLVAADAYRTSAGPPA
jgi:hypothetical protein